MKTRFKILLIAAALLIGLLPASCTNSETPKTQIDYCIITWELNDGEWEDGFEPVTKVEKDTRLIKPKPDPIKEGFTLNGWYTDADLENQFVFSRTVTADTTLYARWLDKLWTISWELNGGAWDEDYDPASNVDKDEILTMPDQEPTKNEATFDGWFTDTDFTDPYTFTEAVTKNLKLYAKWIDDWAIVWNLNGGSWDENAAPPSKIPHNTVLAAPDSDPAKTDSVFGGWFTDTDFTTEYTFTEAVTDEVTLHAKWIEFWSVTWTLNEGSWSAGHTPPSQVEKGTALAKPSINPSRSGHIFVGWFADTALTTEYNFTQTVTANLTLYAKWDVYVPGEGPIYLAFTADVHYGSHSSGNGASANGTSQVASLYIPWMDNLKTQIPVIDYMGFCGDNGNANESGAAHWTGIGHLITAADVIKASGFVQENIFIPGNHEWQTSAGGNLPGIANKEAFPYNRLIYKLEDSGEFIRTADYIIYTSPTGPYDAAFSNNTYGQYKQERRDALAAYLATAPKDIPIFIMAHYPLHSIGSSASGRITHYGADMINILNNYPNVVFFWGHNHSAADRIIHYDTILRPGDKIRAMEGTNISTVKDMEINFTYMSPGAMRDSGYGDSSNLVISKGLVIKIDNGTYTFTFYNKNCEPIIDPSKNFPLTLTKAQLTTGK